MALHRRALGKVTVAFDISNFLILSNGASLLTQEGVILVCLDYSETSSINAPLPLFSRTFASSHLHSFFHKHHRSLCLFECRYLDPDRGQ
jgi:hypothetical protein